MLKSPIILIIHDALVDPVARDRGRVFPLAISQVPLSVLKALKLTRENSVGRINEDITNPMGALQERRLIKRDLNRTCVMGNWI